MLSQKGDELKHIWLIGPISWDTVISIDSYPKNGGFAQGLTRRDRPGGSAANTAVALATAGVDVNLVSFLGDDENGARLNQYLSDVRGLKLHAQVLPGPSLHALITVDAAGERTVFALERNRLPEIEFNFEFNARDIVVFPVWRDEYLKWLQQANGQSSFTVVGSRALLNPTTSADIAIGSQSDVRDVEPNFKRFSAYILTKGKDGSTYLAVDEKFEMPALDVNVVDATGAGDAYLAGLLLGLAENNSIRTSMEYATRWAAATVARATSIPPAWGEVPQTGRENRYLD